MTTPDYIVIGIVLTFIGVMISMRKHVLEACLGDDGKMQMIEAIGMLGLFMAPTIIFLDLSHRFIGDLDEAYSMVKWMITTSVGGKAVTESVKAVSKPPKPPAEDDGRYD